MTGTFGKSSTPTSSLRLEPIDCYTTGMTIGTAKLLKSSGIIFVVLITCFTAWLIFRPSDEASETDKTPPANRTQAGAENTMMNYCKTTYKEKTQKALGKTIDASAISFINYNTVMEGNYVRIAMDCHIDSIDTDENTGGFNAYLHYKKDRWTIYTTSPKAPNCELFDGSDWPTGVVSACYDASVDRSRGIQ